MNDRKQEDIKMYIALWWWGVITGPTEATLSVPLKLLPVGVELQLIWIKNILFWKEHSAPRRGKTPRGG